MSRRLPAGVSICASCGEASAAGQRFCIACGAELPAVTCPSCGVTPPSGARFCGACGAQLGGAVAPSAPERPAGPAPTERRLVSVLFADLVGFTAQSEDEDPEAVREFLSSYFERASEVIERYGGTVEKFIGDAVMAVWGTPTAHEDDAERAVRAALDLVAAVGAPGSDTGAQLRAAVMTGETAVSPSARGQSLVAGDLVNTASRLQSAASPGAVLVDETTRVAAGRAVAFDSVGELTLKGKSEPVRAWVAMRVVAERGGSGRREGLEPPFVGRHEELRLLKDSLHATSREGRSRLVTVIGQAGFGKSRLAWELRKYTDGLAETVLWHEGESPPYGEGVAYWALGSMVRWRSRIGDGDSVEVARGKLGRTLTEYVPDQDEREWIEPRLAALLGLADAPAGDRDELFAAWRTFFEGIASEGTVVLIFEDLHRSDDSLFDFIDHLLEWSRDHPILVVGLARPDLLERRPAWGTAQRASTTVHLEPLPAEAIGDMLRGLVPGLPEGTLSEILERSEGIPLYAVETVRMLLDEGRLVQTGERYTLVDPEATVAVPATLQALVSARLDALEAAERSLVQDAAVLGKAFRREALAAVSGVAGPALDALLQQLIRKEILSVDRSRTAPERGQYAFVQSLLRDVAYSTLSRRDRRGRHMAAAQHYESLGDEELAGLVAAHLLDAYRAVPDGPEGREAAGRASVALRTAAERSIALHANQAAVTFIEQALTVTDDPEERARLWVMATEPAQAALSVEVGERYIRQAIDWYIANDRHEEADRAVAIMAAWMVHQDRSKDFQALLEERVGRLDDATAGPSAPRLLNELARAYLFADRPDDAIPQVDRGQRLAETLMLEPVMAELFATKSWAVSLQGRPRESILLAEGGLRIAERHGLVNAQLRARMNLSDLLTGFEPRRGYEVASAGIELAERVGHATWAAALAGNESFAALLLGEWHRPIERAAQLDRPNATGLARYSLLSAAAIAATYLGEPMPDGWDSDLGLPEAVHGRSMQLAYRAFIGFASGELEDVDRHAIASTEGGSSHHGESAMAASLAARALTWLRERDRLAAIVAHLIELPWAGDVKATTVRQAKAALAALDGSYAEAEAGYREVLATWQRLGLRPDMAIARMEMLLLLGDRLTDRAELRAQAGDILTELGAVTLLPRLAQTDTVPDVTMAAT